MCEYFQLKPFHLLFHICSTSFSEVIRSERNTCLIIACEQQSKSIHTCMYIKWDEIVFSQFIDHQYLLPSWFGRFYSFRVSSFSALQTQVFKLNLESISPTFYKQLFRPQIPKAQKRQSSQASFCAFRIWALKNCV